jgi:signal transduction histidine kinase
MIKALCLRSFVNAEPRTPNPEPSVRRPWQIWIVYVASLALIVAGVGWLSFRALEGERAESDALEQAALEENTRLALWRMDSAKAALVSDESARPYFAYMTLYPAERTYGRMFKGKSSVPSPMLLSPLAAPANAEVLVHFQFDSEGRLTSPQVPTGAARAQTVPRFLSAEQVQIAEQNLERVGKLVRADEMLAHLPPVEAAPTELQLPVSPAAAANAGEPGGKSQEAQAQRGGRRSASPIAAQQQEYYGDVNPPGYGQQAQNNTQPQQLQWRQSGDANEAWVEQRARGDNEFQARSNYVNSANLRSGNFNNDLNPLVFPDEISEPSAAADVRSSRMVPRWLGDELVLARRVSVNGREYVQGCLLDWPAIRAGLLADIADLLPNADLVPLSAPPEDGLSRLLASLPVRLLPGEVALVQAEELSPTQQSLLIAWAAMIIGALAVAALLQGVMSLSERRAAFVSAVTHELRTPLTTFRMYAEMLAEGMVADEESRRRYLGTLHVEADRLTHLVENVLAYARLERGGTGGRIAPVTVSALLHEGGDRLASRAEQAGLQLLTDSDESTLAAKALADVSAVEQILFNLVDNACKYAATARDRVLHLEAEADARHVRLRVRDHGQGVSASQRGRLFQPFRKSADEAARSAPGVGLGLALSRRLARQMGGDLAYQANGDTGASFVLTLRRA